MLHFLPQNLKLSNNPFTVYISTNGFYRWINRLVRGFHFNRRQLVRADSDLKGSNIKTIPEMIQISELTNNIGEQQQGQYVHCLYLQLFVGRSHTGHSILMLLVFKTEKMLCDCRKIIVYSVLNSGSVKRTNNTIIFFPEIIGVKDVKDAEKYYPKWRNRFEMCGKLVLKNLHFK